jgi:hypothetical protein
MTATIALQAVFWVSVGFYGVAWTIKISDWLVARYHRRLKQADKK